jgi:hypothetical protein
MVEKAKTNHTGFFTQKKLQGDFDYYRAQKIAEAMLANGLISQAEFNKLTDINRRTFSPLYVEIMPKIA